MSTKNKLTLDELRYRQSMPLDIKVMMTKARIREFCSEYSNNNLYVSFSGGKDSTVLMHIIREQMGLDLKAVFLDTWMEYPEVRAFVKTFDNVDIIKPEKTMKEIITQYGWNFPSKDVAEMIEAARRDVPWAINKLNGLDKDGKPSKFREQYKKWWPLVDSPFLISNKCCIQMKERPVAKYEKETGRHPIIAIMADESARRKEAYLRTGCNSFDKRKVFDSETGEYIMVGSDRPMSKPMGFWTENDVLQYIYENKLEIAAPYGAVVEENQLDGQMNLFDMGCTGNCQGCKFKTTGEKRTGCVFCPVGCHLDKFAKFKRLKETHPKLYEYCMDELGARDVLSWIDKHYVSNAA